ncbi:5'-methylthioadenosine/S-adenosylhomocysteine nucleosidase family protein [Streptomyces prunicolor]
MDVSEETVVVLTALPLERRAVRRLLEGLERVDQAGTVFERGRLPGTSWTVYLAATGPGNDSAAVITERAINFVRPQAVFFVGIAGSLKPDVSPGDVVVALDVYAYHGGKESSDGFKGRPRSWETTHQLQQVAMHVDSLDDWRLRLPEAKRHTTNVYFKPIAAGDIVLDAPAESPSRVHLDRNFNDAVAVEMEGAGFANAATKAGVPFLLVRGISDLANGTKQSTDGAGMQETAAQHAALFVTSRTAAFASSTRTRRWMPSTQTQTQT